MAQFTFKCPQCGADIEAEDSFRGQVAECPSCGKGIVIPRNITNKPSPSVRLRPVSRDLPTASQTTSATTTPNRVTEFERMAEKEAERRRQEMRHENMMLLVKVAVVLVLVGGGGIFGFMKWSESKRIEAEQLRAQREAEQAAEREEAERKELLAKEEKEKKSQALTAFHAYLDREEARLKDVIEEAKIAREAIDIDQKELTEELNRIEKEDARLAEISRKRKNKRYDKAEHVLLILKSHELGRLYDKYCGEDLTATRAKYEKAVNTILKMRQEETSRLRANREKYFASIKGIDEEVEQKTLQAKKRIDAANNEAVANLRSIEKKRAKLEQEKKNIEKGSISVAIRGKKNREKRIAEIDAELARLDDMIHTARAVVSGRDVDYAQQDTDVTLATGQKRYARATEARQEADNEVHADMQHESNIFQLASRYEQITLDKLRTAMRVSSEFQSAKAAEARNKLEYITRSAANLELMKSEEIEEIRKKVVAKLAEEVTGDGKEKQATQDE